MGWVSARPKKLLLIRITTFVKSFEHLCLTVPYFSIQIFSFFTLPPTLGCVVKRLNACRWKMILNLADKCVNDAIFISYIYFFEFHRLCVFSLALPLCLLLIQKSIFTTFTYLITFSNHALCIRTGIFWKDFSIPVAYVKVDIHLYFVIHR